MVNQTIGDSVNKGLDYVSDISGYLIEKLNLNVSSGKIINILILLLIIYSTIKLGEKPLKFTIIILTVILIIQVIVSY